MAVRVPSTRKEAPYHLLSPPDSVNCAGRVARAQGFAYRAAAAPPPRGTHRLPVRRRPALYRFAA